MIHYGEKLRELVEGSKVSKKEVAEALGITSAGLSSIFSSENTKIDTIYKICGACGMQAWQFVAEIETGMPAIFLDIMHKVMQLEASDRTYILKQTNLSMDYIVSKHKK